ncbi:DNA polymerase III subunit beta [Candidatus Parcubacteria bacterium]|jgi:DNA polymerase-3 subunit beta|nr:MAG: DNA polymerase III subunit beta [Candidatus Parcubacteria bacterium]
MKCIILKNNLIEGLSAVERAIGFSTNLPILKNVLIKTFQGKIFFVATNLEIAVTETIPGKVIEEGVVTVPLSIFFSVSKNLTTDRVTLEESGGNLSIITDNYEAVIQGHDAKEFPIIPSLTTKDFFTTIDIKIFSDIFERVFIATQYSEIRPQISGVFLKYSQDHLIVAATDSFRLAERVISSNQATSSFEETSLIIPFKTAEELLRLTKGQKGNLIIKHDEGQVEFIMEKTNMISRIVDGVFPEYKALIPKTTECEVTVDRMEFIQALKLASSFSGKTNDITVVIGENKKYLELISSDASLGKNCYKIPIKLKGEPLSIVFNWKFLLDGLKIYSSKEIVVGINSPDRPAVIKSQNEQELVYVVMPIRN